MVSFQHAPFDAMVLVKVCYYVDENILENEGRWKVCQKKLFPPFSPHIFIDTVFLSFPYFQGSEKVRDIPVPEELVFTVDEKVLNDINQAKAQYFKQVDFSLFSLIVNTLSFNYSV